jgi:hypothetical protein
MLQDLGDYREECRLGLARCGGGGYKQVRVGVEYYARRLKLNLAKLAPAAAVDVFFYEVGKAFKDAVSLGHRAILLCVL